MSSEATIQYRHFLNAMLISIYEVTSLIITDNNGQCTPECITPYQSEIQHQILIHAYVYNFYYKNTK